MLQLVMESCFPRSPTSVGYIRRHTLSHCILADLFSWSLSCFCLNLAHIFGLCSPSCCFWLDPPRLTFPFSEISCNVCFDNPLVLGLCFCESRQWVKVGWVSEEVLLLCLALSCSQARVRRFCALQGKQILRHSKLGSVGRWRKMLRDLGGCTKEMVGKGWSDGVLCWLLPEFSCKILKTQWY